MQIRGFGVNTRRTDGDFRRLEDQLAYLKEAGFEYLEVSADVVDTIGGGRIVERRMELLQKVLQRYGFRHTAHIHNGVDLRDPQDREFQLRSFRSGIEFAGRIGAELLVFHFEQASEDPRRETLFREAVLEGLEQAGRWGLKLGLENIEIDRLSRAAQLVREVSRPELVLALDVGHAFLSEQFFGENFLDSIRRAADLVGHIHLSDNYGRFEPLRLDNFDLYRVSSYTNRLNSGRGDLNLPPGWGAVPNRKVLEMLQEYRGVVILEYYHDKYLPFNPQILQETRRMFGGTGD